MRAGEGLSGWNVEGSAGILPRQGTRCPAGGEAGVLLQVEQQLCKITSGTVLDGGGLGVHVLF